MAFRVREGKHHVSDGKGNRTAYNKGDIVPGLTAEQAAQWKNKFEEVAVTEEKKAVPVAQQTQQQQQQTQQQQAKK